MRLFLFISAVFTGLRFALPLVFCFLVSACGGLAKKTVLINNGDDKSQVLKIMGGAPDDRQFKDENEAWQYCQTGAGFGYHDHALIWFFKGKVSGINSYKSYTPAQSCVGGITPIKWENAPDTTLEVRHR